MGNLVEDRFSIGCRETISLHHSNWNRIHKRMQVRYLDYSGRTVFAARADCVGVKAPTRRGMVCWYGWGELLCRPS